MGGKLCLRRCTTLFCSCVLVCACGIETTTWTATASVSVIATVTETVVPVSVAVLIPRAAMLRDSYFDCVPVVTLSSSTARVPRKTCLHKKHNTCTDELQAFARCVSAASPVVSRADLSAPFGLVRWAICGRENDMARSRTHAAKASHNGSTTNDYHCSVKASSILVLVLV